MILHGKRVLVAGVLNDESIGFHVAERATELGAAVVCTALPRTERIARRALARISPAPELYTLDVSDEGSFAALATELTRSERLDGVLHAIAGADADALGGGGLGRAEPAAATKAWEVSARSFARLVHHLDACLALPGASVVALDFEDPRGWHVYDWMGVAKASLRAGAVYLARDLGPRGGRVNLVASGPLETVAGSALPHWAELKAAWSAGAPLGWEPLDRGPVADTVCFLWSDLARMVTGETLHADGGVHATGLMPGPGS